MATTGTQNGQLGLEKNLPLIFWRSLQVLVNKIFDSSTLSMRNIDNGRRKDRNERDIELRLVKIAVHLCRCQLPARNATDCSADACAKLILLNLLLLTSPPYSLEGGVTEINIV